MKDRPTTQLWIIARRLLIVWALAAQTTFGTIYRLDGSAIPGTEQLNIVPGVDLTAIDLTQANLANSDLRSAILESAILQSADLTDARIEHASFASIQNLSAAQIYGTASYKSGTMQGVNLRYNNLIGWNFAGIDLTDANFEDALVAEVDFSSAVIIGVDFEDTDITWQQISSTASFQAKDLRRVNLEDVPMQDWDLSGQNLSGADLRGAGLIATDVRNADLSEARIERSRIWNDSLTHDQLYSTASYRAKNLYGIDFLNLDVSGFDFRNQNLADAQFRNLSVRETDFRGANLANANLQVKDIAEAIWDSTTTYDQYTRFPDAFDPLTAGLTFIETQLGDLNGDGLFDAEDLTAMHWIIYGGARFSTEYNRGVMNWQRADVNQDGSVRHDDLLHWVNNIRSTRVGDANLDGVFNSADIVVVFTAGEYEDGFDRNSSWSEGDWNLDGDFNSSDLVTAFSGGDYQSENAALAVPELTPSLLAVGIVPLLFFHRPSGLRTGSRSQGGRASEFRQKDV